MEPTEIYPGTKCNALLFKKYFPFFVCQYTVCMSVFMLVYVQHAVVLLFEYLNVQIV